MPTISRSNKELIAHFWDRVDKSRGPRSCWLWTGALTGDGYGHFKHKGKAIYAHRLAFELSHGAVLPGFHVCHSCDNPPCCNPAHLWAGSASDNMQDREQKHRGRHTKPGHQP